MSLERNREGEMDGESSEEVEGGLGGMASVREKESGRKLIPEVW